MNYDKKSLLSSTEMEPATLQRRRKGRLLPPFSENGPSGKIDVRQIQIGCNTAVDAGLYTFNFAKTGAV